MGRPKKIEDREVLSAAATVIGRRGPVAFTIREVAAEAGLSAAAVMQRYKTKRGLLLALEDDGRNALNDAFDQATRHHPAPLDNLVEGLARFGSSARTRHEMANHLAFLAADLSDPEFHRRTLALFDDFRTRVRHLIVRAQHEGAVATSVDAERLAADIEIAYNGALVTWAIRGGGKPEDAVRRAVRSVLEPTKPKLKERK